MERIGKYELRRKLGKGGFGVVWEGWDPHLKRRVAIKVCTAEDIDLRKRFAREAEAAGPMDHPNVVRVHEFGYAGETPYLVQEFLDGEDLSRRLERSDAPLSLEEKLRILAQVARGLEHAHGFGIVHRDVKPGNIRLLPDGRVKLLDFGIARLESSATRLTRTGTAIGTVAYMAPEQVERDSVSPQSDLFSLGVVAYELLSGARPFDAESMSRVFFRILNEHPRPLTDLDPEVPPIVASLVARCLAKQPEGRPRNASEVAQLLEAALREQTDASFAPSTMVAAAELAKVALPSGPAGSKAGVEPSPQAGWQKWLGVAATIAALSLLGLGLWVWNRAGERAKSAQQVEPDRSPVEILAQARKVFEVERHVEALELAYSVRRVSQVSKEAQELATTVLEHLAESVRVARNEAEGEGAPEIASVQFEKGKVLETLALERLMVGYWVGAGLAYESASLAFFEAAHAARRKKAGIATPAP